MTLVPKKTLALTLGLLSMIAASPATSETAIGGAPGDWLSRYSGSRSVGLGGAYVALSHDALGMVWNPAGLSGLDQNELRVENVQLFEGTSINSLGFVVPGSRYPTFGFAMLSMGSGDFERTTELNEPLGNFEDSQTAFLFTLSKNINPRLALGSTIKVIRQSLEDFSGGGTGLDLGFTFDATPRLRVGGSVLNLGGPNVTMREVTEEYPTEARGGLALRVLGNRGIISTEIDHRSGFDTTLRAGTEVWVHSNFALRLGYDDSRPSGGMSYQMPTGLRLDYGAVDHELGVTHRLGLSYRFGGFFANSQASPEIFSPTGETAVTKFHLQTRTKSEPRSWTMEIYNKSDERVRRFGGKGTPPAHVLWDGKDEAGLPLPDGIYQYRLTVLDAEGRELLSRDQTVEISTSGPAGSIQVD